ncbi:MAG: S8 family peptidase, partial [Solirubrobacterales bacterium]
MGGDVLVEMRGARVTIAAIGGLVIALTAATASPALLVPSEEPDPETGQAIVTVSTPELPSARSAAARQRWQRLRDRSRGLLEGVAERNDLAVMTWIPEIGILSVDLGRGGLAALRAELADEPRVQSVRPDRPFELRYQPNDYAFNHLDSHAPNGDVAQWHLLRSGAARAWDLSKGAGAEVAVIDTGANGSHPDLAGRIVGTSDRDPTLGAPGPTVDTFGHGTHTAGLACADSDNGFGIASLGFDCSLFIAKLATDPPFSACSYVADAITDAGNRFSDVISMSLGGCDTSLNSALNYALSRGSVLVAAGANDPTPNPNLNFPAQWVQPEGTGPQVGFDRGLVVTSTKYDGARSSFAQMTTGVSVAAFGSASDALSGDQQGILSTFPPPTVDLDSLGARTTVNGDNRFAYLAGTSMATPQVAGLAALIRAVKPNLAAPQVAHLIKETATGCGSYGNGIGWGVIRADRAVAAALGQEIDPPSSNVRSARFARRAAAAGLATAARGRGRVINLRLKRADAGACANDLPVAGLRAVNVFASANGGLYHRIGKTKKKRLRFHAKP